jgi:hypothetical protein
VDVAAGASLTSASTLASTIGHRPHGQREEADPSPPG